MSMIVKVSTGSVEQVPPQSAGSLVGREPGRQNQRAPAAGLEEPQATLEEELIQVCVAGALEPVLAGFPWRRPSGAARIAAFRLMEDVPRRISKHHVEA